MKDNINRKSEDKSNKMLSEPSLVFKKTIQTLKKKYGYSSKQIFSEFPIPDSSLLVDFVIFTKDDEVNPKIIGEVKTGNFVFPLAEYQLEKYMKISNTKYGFLTNGIEWINYKSLDGKIIRIDNIPTAKELKSILEGKVEKKFTQLTNANYILKKFTPDLWVSNESPNDTILQLIFFKLYDENYEKNKNFKKIANYPETHLEVFETLWKKINEKFPDLFLSNYLQELDHNFLSQIIEFANFSITKSDPVIISKILLEKLTSVRGRDYNGSPQVLIQFIESLNLISDTDKIIIPYSGPDTTIHLLGILFSKFKTNFKGEIIVIEPNYEKIKILKIISELKLPKFQIFSGDPIKSPILDEFNRYDHVISIPPFGLKYSKNKNNVNEIDFEDYGSQTINYFIKRLISTFKNGTQFSLIVPQSFLFRHSSGDEKIRKEILETCTLKGIINLPPRTFTSVAIPTSLLLFEVGVSDKKNYDIFMAVVPQPTNNLEKINTTSFIKITESYHDFLNNKPRKNSDQTGFIVNIDEIQQNSWTVTDKIPELKIFEIPYKERISDSVEIIQGSNIPYETSLIGEEFSFIRISDIKENSFNFDKIKNISLDDNSISKYSKYLIKKGDILFSTKGTIGKSLIVNDDFKNFIASNQLLILRCNPNKILPKYLFNMLNSTMVKNQINGLVGGTSIPFLSISKFDRIIISVPPISKQRDNIENSLKLEEEISELEHILNEKRRKLQESRDNG